MAYPSTIDDVHSGIGSDTDPLNNPPHEVHHTDLADAVKALMEFVGTESDGKLDAPGNIKMHNTAYAPIPDGWALCDGTNGTPDLRDKFIVGSGSTYSVGDTGGLNAVTLTTAQLPSHTHASGSLAGNSHTHGVGNFSNNTTNLNHTHGSGSFSSDTANVNHSHTSGSLSSGNTNTAHTHPAQVVATVNSGNAPDTLSRGTGSGGNLFTAISANTNNNATSHAHSISGNTGTNNPSHGHGVSGNSSGANINHAHGFDGNSAGSTVGISGSTGSVGSDSSHENRPPYYALALIMKL